MNVCIGLLFVMGAALIGGALLLEGMFQSTVKKQLVLKEGTQAFKAWKDAPTPVYMSYYLFNYTNADDVVNKLAKPRVSQVGPFVYREIRKNEVLELNEDKITYLQNYSYVFESSLSCPGCNENTQIFAPNIALITLLDILHDHFEAFSFLREFLKVSIDGFFGGVPGTTLFKKLHAGQLLWGYEDDLLSVFYNLESILSKFGIVLPAVDRLIQLQYNGSANAQHIGNTTILTGYQDINDVQKIVRWRGWKKVPFWNTRYANMINGTDGSHGRPFLKRGERMFAFNPQICRSVRMDFEEDVSVEKISMYTYTTKLFSPNDRGFCDDDKTCFDGLLPLSKCVGGAEPPVYASSPHFFQADPKLSQRIDGLEPNKDKHKMVVDIEPTTGLMMSANKRIQISLLAKRGFIAKSQAFREKINMLPIFWLDESVRVDKVNAKKFDQKVLLPKRIIGYLRPALLVVGVLMLIIGAALSVKLWRRSGCKQDQIGFDSKAHRNSKAPIVQEKSDALSMYDGVPAFTILAEEDGKV